MKDPQGIAAERTSVLPAFAETEFQVPDGRTLDRDLGIVPGRGRPVDRRHRLALPVALMIGIVAPAVTEIDAADESNVVFGCCRVPCDDELLVVGATESHSLVEQDLAARRVDLLAQVAVLLGAETESVKVRAPEQSSDDHAAPGGRGDDSSYLRIQIVAQTLVRVAAPVREVEPVACAQLANRQVLDGRRLGLHRMNDSQQPVTAIVSALGPT